MAVIAIGLTTSLSNKAGSMWSIFSGKISIQNGGCIGLECHNGMYGRAMAVLNEFCYMCKDIIPVDSTLNVYDPLFKVRKHLDLTPPKLESDYNPHEHLSIDEAAMIPFKRRLGFKQYMNDKPTKWGVKHVWSCNAELGYMCKDIIPGERQYTKDLCATEAGLAKEGRVWIDVNHNGIFVLMLWATVH